MAEPSADLIPALAAGVASAPSQCSAEPASAVPAAAALRMPSGPILVKGGGVSSVSVCSGSRALASSLVGSNAGVDALLGGALPDSDAEREPSCNATSLSHVDDLGSLNKWAECSPEPCPWDALSVSSLSVAEEPRPVSETLDAATEAAGPAEGSDISDWQCVVTPDPGNQLSKGVGVSSSAVPAQVSVNRAVQQAVARFAEDPAAALRLPWETPLMKAIFSEDDATALANLVPVSFAFKRDASSVAGRPSALKLEGNICEHAIRKFRDDDNLLKEERLLHRATAKWALVVFRYARECGLAPETEEEIIACFGTRSVHTVTKRANTFAAYLRWLDVVSNSNVSAFCDAAYWKYLKFLESSGAAASSATSFLSSVRFSKFVLGLSRAEEPSRKCVGLSETLAGQAGVVRQAAPLTVDQILVIHEALHSEDTSRWDRAFCAYCLVALYGRARHSDLKRISHIEWDVPQDADRSRQGSQGYIIIYTKHHKTSRATAKKLRLLPIVIPVAGIHSKPWIHAAQDAFAAVHLTLRGEVNGPLFRPPRNFDSLSLCRRSITSDEVSVFVRLLLGLGRDAPTEGDRVTSHSMKRTCLSWASKAGFDRLTRSCLGRHAYATEGTEAIYSVELSLPHVQKLEALIKFIVNGSFAADASRALMWAFPPPAAEIASPGRFPVPAETSSVTPAEERPGAVEPDSGDEGQSSSSTSSSSSSSESDSDGGSEGSLTKRRRAGLADDKRIEPEGGWVVHRRSYILHRVYRGKILMCGRPRTQAYDLVEDITRMGNLVCKTSAGAFVGYEPFERTCDREEVEGMSFGAAMTSLVESEAHFEQRASEVRLSDTSVQALRRHGFKTLGQLAYTVGQPGQLIPEAEFTDWCRNHVPAASAADLASLKRLLFEAQTLALTQLRAQVTEPDSASKRVPEAERERRLQQLRDELSGLNIEGPLEPGRKLLDECSHQEAVGQLKYLSPDKCVSRLHEVTRAKDSSRQVEIDQSRFIIKETQDEFSMPASSALQVQEALRRRGLAYTFAQAVSWNAYDKYVTKLFGHMHRDPPPSHNRISVSQIVEADRLVFTHLIELNIKPKQEPSGLGPLDEALHAALESHQVSFALMHLASKGGNNPRRPWKRQQVQQDCVKSLADRSLSLIILRKLSRESEHPGGHSWTSGAYVRGGNLGARCNMKLFPAVSALLAVLLRAACDDAVFTSLALLTNQSAWVHKDLNNASGSINTAIALSSFSGGGIWVQGGGKVPCPLDPNLDPGCIRSFAEGVVRFDSHELHCTEPWAGNRCILVGFVVKGYQAFSPDLIGDLLKLGFNLPDLGTGDIFAAPGAVPSFPVVLEVFSGMGRLTAQLRARGASGSLAVDSAQVSAPAAPPKILDVAQNQQLLLAWLEADHVVGVHFAPPLLMPSDLELAVASLVSRAVELCLLVSIELPLSCQRLHPSGALRLVARCADSAPTREFCLLLLVPMLVQAAQLWVRTYAWDVAAKLADGFVPRRFLIAVLLVRGQFHWPVARMERLKSDFQLPPHLDCDLRVLPTGAQLLRVLQNAIQRNASSSSEQLARDRAIFFKTWLSRAKELENEEASFKASLEPHVASILAPKRLLLFKELLSAYEYPDPEVFDEITHGIRLTGQTPNTGIFPPTFKPAMRQAANLEKWAPGSRSRVLEA
ncbi:unnamed protein product [Symbiodinium sp. CCMP2592]|nr:unnamed protein product [Symbiodinium sp. CCMP2592]